MEGQNTLTPSLAPVATTPSDSRVTPPPAAFLYLLQLYHDLPLQTFSLRDAAALLGVHTIGTAALGGKPFNPFLSNHTSIHGGQRRLSRKLQQLNGRFEEFSDLYPYSAVGRVRNDGSDGEGGSFGLCSGTLITPRHVLTAAHCVYDTGANEWQTGLMFDAGLDGDDGLMDRNTYQITQPATLLRAFADGMEVACSNAEDMGCLPDEVFQYDYAVLTLDEDAGYKYGWLGFGSVDECGASNYAVTSAGYPGDKPDSTLWRVNCDIAFDACSGDINDLHVQHTCETAGGQSGSSMWTEDNIVRAVIVSSGPGSVSMSEQVVNNVYRWSWGQMNV